MVLREEHEREDEGDQEILDGDRQYLKSCANTRQIKPSSKISSNRVERIYHSSVASVATDIWLWR